MKTKVLITLAAACSIGATVATTKMVSRFPDTKVTARVVDEDEMPIPKALVSFGFLIPDDFEAKREKAVNGLTDENGLFSGIGPCDGLLGAEITKDTYYRSGLAVPRFSKVEYGRWQPWNPTVTTILRPIGRPVPMYVKKVETQVPATGQPCGYDLMKGDWVSPWGKGEVADFVFTANCEYKDYLNYNIKYKLTFSDPQGGIQIADLPDEGKKSEFKWHRESPKGNYKFALTFECSMEPRDGIKTNYVEKRCYYFRTRTQESNGQLISGLYGKIDGDFRVTLKDDGKKCGIIFLYYLNPNPLDRNMEFDPKKNLFPANKKDRSSQRIFRP